MKNNLSLTNNLKNLEASIKIIQTQAAISSIQQYQSAIFQSDIISFYNKIIKNLTEHEPSRKILNDAINCLIWFSARDNLFIYDEVFSITNYCNKQGASFTISEKIQRGGPIKNAPTEHPFFDVYVDESGSDNFAELEQPVLCIIGVIMPPSGIDQLKSISENLLDSYNLPKNIEIHAKDCIDGIGDFGILSAEKRHKLLKDFVNQGLYCCSGIHCFPQTLKKMVQPQYIKLIDQPGLDLFIFDFRQFVATLELAFASIGVPARYRFFYDRTDAHTKDIKKTFRILKESTNPHLKINRVAEGPKALDSKDSRGIQLADVIGFYLNRYRQLEVPNFKPSKGIKKHEKEIRELYDIISPKIADWIGNKLYMIIDLDALKEFSLQIKKM